ncbi:MAG: hypothetical protein WKF89_06960, partial [Chitinophagaceae bacterium]
LLVFIAFLIAVPVSWWVSYNWLQDFAYRISIKWSVFIVAGLISLIVTLLTVSYQAIKTAMMDPAKTLRAE